MTWNGKTTRRDRKRRGRARKRNEVFWISPTGTLQPATYRIHRGFKKITGDHLPIADTINFTPIKYLGFGDDE